MDSFVVRDRSPEQFADRVRAAALEQGLADALSVRVRGDVLEVRFSRLGTSVLRYHLDRRDGGFAAQLAESRMAAFHAPFRATLESRFADVIRHLGGRVE